MANGKATSLTEMDFTGGNRGRSALVRSTVKVSTSVAGVFTRLFRLTKVVNLTWLRRKSKKHTAEEMELAVGNQRLQKETQEKSPSNESLEQDLLTLGAPPPTGTRNPMSRSRASPTQDKKRKASKNKPDEDKDASDEQLDFFSDNPRYRKRQEKEFREKRLAAGESLDDINKTIQKMRKKGPVRSPAPPGVF